MRELAERRELRPYRGENVVHVVPDERRSAERRRLADRPKADDFVGFTKRRIPPAPQMVAIPLSPQDIAPACVRPNPCGS